MSRKTGIILVILVSIASSVSGQLLLKKGMTGFGEVHLDSVQAAIRLLRVFTVPVILLGLGLYMAGSMFWLFVLSRAELSFVYPMISLSYVIIAFFSWIFLGEHISSYRWLGIALILLGITLVSRTRIGGENDLDNNTDV